MDILINPKSEKPIYIQLYEGIVSQILCGALKADEMLPSMRLVAKELSVSIITVKIAWEKLETDGYIYTRAGKGCFVNDHADGLTKKRILLAEEKIKSDLQYYKSTGLTKQELLDIIERNY